jgi:redox-sensitive bicupin YhaK (pirin superfamily)
VLDGELAHKDSMGNGSVIRPGDVQRLSAGTGIVHSEFNPAHDRTTHFLQIWIEPDVLGIAPSYEEKHFALAEKQGVWRQIASPDGAGGSLQIHQDARVYASALAPGEAAAHGLAPGRMAYLHVIRGAAVVNGNALATGDAARIVDEAALQATATQDSELLLFDLPPRH